MIDKIIFALKQQMIDLPESEILAVGSDKPGLIIEDEIVRFIPTNHDTSFASDKRNIGMRFARGDILLFLDDDCIPQSNWLECHLQQHKAGKLIVGGAVTFDKRNYFQLADNVSAFHDLLPFTKEETRSYLATANLSVHRSVVEKAGEMEAHQNRADDLEWTVRFRKFGYKLYFDPRAIVFHYPPRNSLIKVWRHWTDDAPNTLKVRLKYPDLLQTPGLARYRLVFLWGAPLVAAWATVRTFNHYLTILKYGYTLPLVYLTKLAWCWSAFKNYPRTKI